jgi:hypothetical protein
MFEPFKRICKVKVMQKQVIKTVHRLKKSGDALVGRV